MFMHASSVWFWLWVYTYSCQQMFIIAGGILVCIGQLTSMEVVLDVGIHSITALEFIVR